MAYEQPTKNALQRSRAARTLIAASSALCIVIVLVLTACATVPVTPSTETSETPMDSAAITTAPSSSTQEPDTTGIIQPIEEQAHAFVDPYIDEALALIDADRRPLSDITFGYETKLQYEDLSPEEKTLYDEIFRSVQSLTPFSYTAAQHGHEVMDRAMAVCIAVQIDHPELENYFMLREVTEGDTTTAVEALYFMPWDSEQQPADPALLRDALRRFDAVGSRIIERMPDEYSTYDKYRYLALVISLMTSYDHDNVGGWQVGTAYGAVVSGYSICQGYSRGFLYLCQKANLWCETVEGVAGENEGHAWNMVKLDSGTYFIDITWCDEAGIPGSTEWHHYFMLTQDELLIDHKITDGKVATGTGIN